MRVLGSYPLDEMASLAGSLDNGAVQTLQSQIVGSPLPAVPSTNDATEKGTDEQPAPESCTVPTTAAAAAAAALQATGTGVRLFSVSGDRF